MKTLILFLAVLFTTHLHAGNNKVLEKKNGFRQYKLGSDITKYKSLKLKGKYAVRYQLYLAKKEKYSLGRYQINTVEYVAYKGKLYAIMLSVKGKYNYNGLMYLLKMKYGKPYQANQFIEEYIWYSDNVYLQMTIKKYSDYAIVIFKSRPMATQSGIDKKNESKKASNDL